MLYSLSTDNQKILAEPNKAGICPYCRQELVPKCGAIKSWHWAHRSLSYCDTWSDGETPWHLNWKSRFPKDHTEVIISKGDAKHIADYFNPVSNVTVEFQNSSISFYERLEREMFYNNLQWIVHIDKDTIINPELEYLYFLSRRCGLRNPDGIDRIKNSYTDLSQHNFWWKHPKQWITATPAISNNIYLDSDFFPDDLLFKLKRIKPWNTRMYIDGVFISKDRFVDQLYSGV